MIPMVFIPLFLANPAFAASSAMDFGQLAWPSESMFEGLFLEIMTDMRTHFNMTPANSAGTTLILLSLLLKFFEIPFYYMAESAKYSWRKQT